jgi:hypothetical protein
MANDLLTLYRGLAVPSEDAGRIKQQILEGGFKVPEGGRWKILINDLRSELEGLYSEPDLSRHDTVCDARNCPVVCACGDVGGAAYYAWKHNNSAQHNTPLVVEFEADASDVFVDGRDFLFSAFQFWDRDKADSNGFERQASALATIFGDAILRYFRQAASSEEQEYRIAMCRLAGQDIGVVRSHVRNTHIIRGRYGTTFCSAILVKTPVAPSRIKAVTAPPYPTGSPWLTLQAFHAADIPHPLNH